jgi:NADPH2:quinone reductase
VLVRVRASALNRADLMQREGRYPAPPDSPQDIPGMEIAGEVAETGPGVSRWKVGDRVFGIVGGGGNAEYCVTREAELAQIPQSLSFDLAAAVPEAFITAHDALISQAQMRPGESALVHAIGSGVGLAASQLVASLGGTCYGTARTQDKIDRAKEYGMADGIAVRDDLAPLQDAVKRWTNGAGVNVVLDLVGGPYAQANLDCAAKQARIILIGLVAGRSANLALGTILNKRLSIRGTVMRARSAAEKAAATEAFVRDVLPLLTRGSVKPVVDKVYALDDIADAHRRIESNQSFGKVVISSA